MCQKRRLFFIEWNKNFEEYVTNDFSHRSAMGWSASASVSRSTLKIHPFNNICHQKYGGPLGHDFYDVCNMYLYDTVFVTKKKKAIL